MDDERMRILRMVEQGKVTPEEGGRLLDAISSHERASWRSRPPAGRSLRVKVRGPGREKVDFAVPLALAQAAIGMVPEAAAKKLEAHGIKVGDLSRLFSEVGGAGPVKIVAIEADEGEVEVSIE